MDWIIERIDAIGRSVSSLKKDSFNSGKPELDRYLKQYAIKNDAIGIARTFVALPAEGSRKIAGYYACSASSFDPKELPIQLRERLPGYPIPAILIGKLAVDQAMQGRGLGKRLLIHAFENAIDVSEFLGIYAVKVDAIDEQAKEFYQKFGFREMSDTPFSLFLPLTIVKEVRNYARSQSGEPPI